MHKFVLISAAAVGTAVVGSVLNQFRKDYVFYKKIDQIRSATTALADQQAAEKNEAALSNAS